MKMTLILFTLFSSLSSYAQMCATPMDCYQVEQKKKAEAIRLKQERDEAAYREEQLRLENAQLLELQEQRAVMEEELEEMNATQQRMEDMRIQEIENAEAEKSKAQEKTTNEEL